MKKLAFSALILGLFFTVSCNKDDDGGGGNDNCQTCEAYEFGGVNIPSEEVCEGENGNAFVDGNDTGMSFDDYITTMEVITNCN